MQIVELLRLETGQAGTFGVLRIAKTVFCSTLEPPDQLNAKNISCIPTGQYICRRHSSPRFGETFQVDSVPWRSNILFHAGNVSSDTNGCIILGQYPGKLRGDRAVLNSGDTFKAFMLLLVGQDEFHLTISEHY